MVSVEDATTARLSRGGMDFEILVDPDLALRMKKGEDVSTDNLLASHDIFSDAKKGERVSGEDLEKVFRTTDVSTITKSIIQHGEIQLTTEQRRKFTEEKKKQISELISKQGVDPKTKNPHPQARILNAMDQAHVNIDPFKPAREQLNDILPKLQEILPISLEKVEIAISVPMAQAGKVSSEARHIAPIKSEEWKSDAWHAVMEIPAGMQSEIYEKLNNITHGNIDVKILKEHKI